MSTRLTLVALLATIAAACSSPAPTTPTSTPPKESPAPAPAPSPSPSPSPVPVPDPVAHYVVTFQSDWSPATHPTDWPEDAHYSGLIGGTHSSRVNFWQEGQLASLGIQLMAEKGRKSPLDQEVLAAISAGNAESVLSGDALSGSPRSVSLEFAISVNFPLVTLVTMVAPSPDWFVGVSGLSLLQKGQWADEAIATLFPWDAGTDSGITYAAENLESRPPTPIHRLLGFPVAVNGVVAPFGTMTFRRIR